MRLEKIIHDLKTHGIITPEFAKKLITSKNIDEFDEETTLLHLALFKGASLFAIQELVALGSDLSIKTTQSCTPLMLAVSRGDLDIVKFFLAITRDVSETHAYGGNILHVASRHNHSAIIKLLLTDPKVQAIKDVQDVQGRTPLMIAIQYAFDDCIHELTGEPVEPFKSHPSYGHAPTSFDQRHFNKNLCSYLQMKGVEDESSYLDEGSCNGLTFMYPFYKHGMKETASIESLNFISAWDGQKDSFQEMTIPEKLRGKFSRMGVDKPEYIFDRILNDTVLFQASSMVYKELRLKCDQSSIEERYELIKADGPPFTKKIAQYKSVNRFTKEQLIEMLVFLSGHRECLIIMGGAQHVTSMWITREGEYDYYDCNFKVDGELRFMSAEKLAEHIVKTKYILLHQPHESVWIDFEVYVFYEKEEALANKSFVSSALSAVSPNRFNLMHYAVMENNLHKVQKLLDDQGNAMVKLTEKDSHGLTPIERALDLGYLNIAEEILRKFQFNEDLIASLIDRSMKQCDLVCFELIIKMYKNDLRNLCSHIITNNDDSSKAIALLDLVSKIHGPLDFSCMPSLFNFAIGFGKPELVNYMLQHNANPRFNVKGLGSGLSNAAYQYENSTAIIDMLIPHLKEVNAKDESGYCLMDYARKYNKTGLIEHLDKIMAAQACTKLSKAVF